ncbi:Plasmid replication protein RepB (plasmid) [Rhodovulum sp. P5]|uniref:ParB/RepB/Spo0J family partition protein n=1 Tax=Rhodovulum sp. P5 TaxID=1564506 RepID=UPI0009C20D04|nr:ParB N-terminal domain-containing protein [Rhodovulum sp. P5]ARE42545.1 Plasmid replication protein RepB [Rhodovulum sp. P5]
MAKRKRLSPAAPDILGPAPETKAMGVAGVYRRPAPPIADVSGDAATRAALEEVSRELTSARAEGRFVMRLPLEAVEAGHLVRDRIAMDEDDLTTLMESLKARGQQMPIEVVDLGAGRYGLISGWRRLTALKRLHAETGEDRFTQVQALVRTPEGAPEAYVAMVEENEIRANLSFYERARIAVKAVEQGVFPRPLVAVRELFAAAPAPKRSKILTFTALVEALDDALRFPHAIPEHLGLKLVAALEEEAGFADRLVADLAAADPEDALAERKVLDAALKALGQGARPAAPPAGEEPAPGVTLKRGRGRLTLSGPGVDDALIGALRDWLAARGAGQG